MNAGAKLQSMNHAATSCQRNVFVVKITVIFNVLGLNANLAPKSLRATGGIQQPIDTFGNIPGTFPTPWLGRSGAPHRSFKKNMCFLDRKRPHDCDALIHYFILLD
jgi:hypothetical protein